MPPKATPNATINNAQLFAIYTEKLRSHNPQVYATFAAKLANWLSDDRAYYGDARPKIIEMLMVAYHTLRATSGNPHAPFPLDLSNHPSPNMVEAYSNLIRVLRQHIMLYRNDSNSDKEKLQALHNTVPEVPAPNPVVPASSAGQNSSASSNTTHQSVPVTTQAQQASAGSTPSAPTHQPQATPVASSSSSAIPHSGQPPPQSSQQLTSTSAPAPVVKLTTVSSPPLHIQSAAPTPTPISMPMTIPGASHVIPFSPAVESTPNPSPQLASQSPSIASSSTPVIAAAAAKPRKKRKKADLSSILEIDIMAAAGKKGTVITKQSSTPQPPPPPAPAPASVAGPSTGTKAEPIVIDLTDDTPPGTGANTPRATLSPQELARLAEEARALNSFLIPLAQVNAGPVVEGPTFTALNVAAAAQAPIDTVESVPKDSVDADVPGTNDVESAHDVTFDEEVSNQKSPRVEHQTPVDDAPASSITTGVPFNNSTNLSAQDVSAAEKALGEKSPTVEPQSAVENDVVDSMDTDIPVPNHTGIPPSTTGEPHSNKSPTGVSVDAMEIDTQSHVSAVENAPTPVDVVMEPVPSADEHQDTIMDDVDSPAQPTPYEPQNDTPDGDGAAVEPAKSASTHIDDDIDPQQSTNLQPSYDQTAFDIEMDLIMGDGQVPSKQASSEPQQDTTSKPPNNHTALDDEMDFLLGGGQAHSKQASLEPQESTIPQPSDDQYAFDEEMAFLDGHGQVHSKQASPEPQNATGEAPGSESPGLAPAQHEMSAFGIDDHDLSAGKEVDTQSPIVTQEDPGQGGNEDFDEEMQDVVSRHNDQISATPNLSPITAPKPENAFDSMHEKNSTQPQLDTQFASDGTGTRSPTSSPVHGASNKKYAEIQSLLTEAVTTLSKYIADNPPLVSTDETTLTSRKACHAIDFMDEIFPLPPSDGFDSSMRILQKETGKRDSRDINFAINVTPPQFEMVSAWCQRNKGAKDVQKSICLSLACYPSSKLLDAMRSSHPSSPVSESFKSVTSSWPKTGELSLQAVFNGQECNFPLSPPLVTTPDGYVDLTPFLVVGQNTVVLKQTGDQQKYVFILQSHHPTRAQLKPVLALRKQYQQWVQWLKEVSKPLEMPPDSRFAIDSAS